MNLAGPLQAVVEEFSKFPGVGAKSARRLALFLLRQPHEQIDSLVESLIGLKTKIKFCKIFLTLVSRIFVIFAVLTEETKR